MQTLQFDFCGARHELTTFDDDDSVATAKDIISGVSYRFPQPSSTLKCVVDLGAHVGEFTIMAAALWPQATIHAFEPNPQVIPLLQQNCQRYANIVVHEQGVRLIPGRG
ncbi:MAG: FkbM family methyltransferase, partial [Planctomycetia bacterium]|nr:FkbM family methyltransferase [Planctomycetia bacterium]